MHIGIYPPDGQIKVSTPLLISDDAVKVALLTRLSWIRRHQERFWQQARESAREMVLGESHWYLGRRYLLSVIEVNSPEATGISILNLNTIELRCRPGANRGQRAALLDAWYRLRLRELIKPMIARWSRELGVEAPVWRIQRMKTKWGSCNEAKGHILLNLDLIKKPRRGIDYVVLHEMAHLIERKHGTVFQRLLDRHMTKWRQISAELGALPLSED
jgi:predicted metal-dependent hydrolase